MSDNILPGRQASFRGVRFHFDNSTDAGGNRIVTHIYPNRDQHANEDLGDSPNTYDVSGYILTPDIELKEAELKQAFADEGAATFFHPMLRANIECQAVNWSFTPSKESVSRRNFTVHFVVEGQKPSPVLTVNAKPKIFGASNQNRKTIVEFFKQSIETASASAETVAHAVESLNGAISQTKDAVFSNFSSGLTDATGDLVIAGSISQDAIKGSDFGLYVNLVDSVIDSYNNDAKRESTLAEISEVSISSDSAHSIQGKVRKNNALVIQSSVRQYALVKLAESIVQTNYEDSEQVHSARFDFVNRVRAEQQVLSEMENGVDSFGTLSSLASLVAEQLSHYADKLKPVAQMKTQTSRSALSLAWDLYQDPTRANDLIVRNSVDNGSFMPHSVRYLSQ